MCLCGYIRERVGGDERRQRRGERIGEGGEERERGKESRGEREREKEK